MAFSEVFTSLQNSTIDAQENPLALIKSASFSEVQKYVNQTDHVLSWIYLVGGSKKLARLTEAQQKAIAESAKAAQAYERELFLADEKQLEADLKAKGMQFVEVDKAAFAAKAKDAVTAALPGRDQAALRRDRRHQVKLSLSPRRGRLRCAWLALFPPPCGEGVEGGGRAIFGIVSAHGRSRPQTLRDPQP